MLKDANAIYTTAGLGYLERLLKFPFVICLMLMNTIVNWGTDVKDLYSK